MVKRLSNTDQNSQKISNVPTPINPGDAVNKEYVDLNSGGDVSSVSGKTGDVVLDKSDVGLSNVDNTSDINKPVSTAQQAVLDGKANSSHTHPATDLTATGRTSANFLRGDNTWATPVNTTYSEISEAEINAGTASTARTISGRRAKKIVDSAVASVDKNAVGLGNVSNDLQLKYSQLDTDGSLSADSDTKVASQKATKEYADRKLPKPNLVDTAVYPMYIAHRNASKLYPEESIEGQQIVAEQGFPIEVDVRALSDGTLVACHDSTVDRTMENISTGAVSTKTVSQWRNARIKPAIRGGKTGTPIFFNDWLDRFGGKYLLVPELKTTASAYVEDMMQAITSRGLEDAVIVQSSDFSIASSFAAAGLRSCYLFNAVPTETPAQIKAAGIEFAGGNTSMTAATVTSLKAAGLKVIMYTVNTVSGAREAIDTKGCDAIFSDDPRYVSGHLPRRTSDPFSEGYGWPGIRGTSSGGTSNGQPSSLYWLEGSSLGMSSAEDVGITTVVQQGWAGKIKRPFRISFDLLVEPNGQLDGLSQVNSIVLWNNSINPDEPYFDEAKPGQEGFVFGIRPNGQAQAWKYVAGAAAATIGQTPVLGNNLVVDTAGRASRVSLTVEATNDTITIYSPSHGILGQWSDTFNPEPMNMALRTPTNGVALYSNIKVLQGNDVLNNPLRGLINKPYDTGWNEMSITGSVVTPYTIASDNKYRRVGSTVEIVGVLGTTGTSLPNGTVFATLPVGFRPLQTYVSRQQGSASDSWCLRVDTNGDCIAERYGPSAVTSNKWLPFSGSFFVD